MAGDSAQTRTGTLRAGAVAWVFGLGNAALLAVVGLLITGHTNDAVNAQWKKDMERRIAGFEAVSGMNRPDKWGKSDDDRTMAPIYDRLRRLEVAVDKLSDYMLSDSTSVQELKGNCERLKADMAECRRRLRW